MSGISSNVGQGELAQELSGHLDFLRRLARALVRDEQIAEDMVQETLLAAVSRPPSAPMGMQAWLRGALRRSVLLHFRTEQRRTAREVLLSREDSAEGRGDVLAAEQILVGVERMTILGSAVAALDEPYRTVVTLRFYENQNPREIAKQLDRSVHTVNTQLQRGLQKLRQDLDEFSGGQRETWVGAVLPFALQGRDGWWPSGVKTFAGLSHGAAASCGLAVALIGVSVWVALGQVPDTAAPYDGQASEIDVASAEGSARRPGGPEVPRRALDRRPALSPPNDPSPGEQAASGPGHLRIQIRAAGGAVAGARVVALLEDEEGDAGMRITSSVQGANGVSLKIKPTGLRRMRNDDERETVVGESDEMGVARLPILDGRPWSVRVHADGFAQRTLKVEELGEERVRTVTLQPGCLVVVTRGGFPLDYNLYVQLQNRFGGSVRDAMIPAGTQQIELTVEPGDNRLEALSAGGPTLAHWNRFFATRPGEALTLDLSEGGVSEFEVEVVGLAPDLPAHFAIAQGSLTPHEAPKWNQIAPVHAGLARFRGVPAGPVRVVVLSRNAEIGSATLESVPGQGPARVRVRVADGSLRIVHPEHKTRDLTIWLAKRSQAMGSVEGWREFRSVLPGQGASVFRGLKAGTYRLAVASGERFDAWTLEHDGGTLEVRFGGDDSSGAGTVRVERGPGAASGAPLEVEIRPGRWAILRPLTADRLKLAHGEHRLRVALNGVGYAVRRVDVPKDSVVRFSETDSPSDVVLTVDGCEPSERLRVVSTAQRIQGLGRRDLPLALDEFGVGTVHIRPGSYRVLDRWGRSALLEIVPGSRRVNVRFSDGAPDASVRGK